MNTNRWIHRIVLTLTLLVVSQRLADTIVLDEAPQSYSDQVELRVS